MRKLIRYSAAAFLAWAAITFAWAALSHVSGLVGPARASAASLEFVADAVTFVNPPGVLGAPQRFAAEQIRQAARSAERLHRGPERAMTRLVDRMGHASRHGFGGRHVHRHVHRHEHRDGGRGWSRAPDVRFEMPVDALDGSAERARRLAIIELERHRGTIARELRRAAREQERAARRFDVRIRVPEGGTVRREFRLFPPAQFESEEDRLLRKLEAVERQLERVEIEQQGELKRRIEEKLREILEELRRELEDLRVRVSAELEGLELDELELEGPVRIQIDRR